MTQRRALLVFIVTFALSSGIASAQAPGPPQGIGAGRGAVPGGRGGFPPVQIGPPAPVPAQVAIPRPTPTELEQVNTALHRLIDSDKSGAQPLLKKYESLMLLQPPRLNTAATFTQTQQRMGPRHEGFVAAAQQGGIDLLLHGDSITDWWLQDANKPVFDKYFGAMRTADFAVAGDTTQGVLWGLRNGEGQGFQPKAVMLMIGTNNMGANTAPEIAEGIGAVVMELRRDFRPRRSSCSPSSRAVCPAIRYATKSRTPTGSSRSWTIRNTCSTWTSARDSSTRRACSCPIPSGPTTCIRKQRAMTSGARRSAGSLPS